jgi:hypothetical protein
VRQRTWLALIVLLTLCTAGLTLASAGCGDPPPAEWQQVASGRFTGARPISMDLGTFNLAGDLRLSWMLTGPADARATFRLRVARITDSGGVETSETHVRSWSGGFSRRNDAALMIGVREPGEYRITLSQQFRPGQESGFGGTYALFTDVVR